MVDTESVGERRNWKNVLQMGLRRRRCGRFDAVKRNDQRLWTLPPDPPLFPLRCLSS
jgi:hypothetical protein